MLTEMRKKAFTPAAAEVLRELQVSSGGIAGCVFWLPSAPDRPPSRHWFALALREAEAAAGLPKLDGSLWHAHRREWATERMHYPVKTVAMAGGWLDPRTLIECYQQPDAAMVREVIEEPRPRRAAAE